MTEIELEIIDRFFAKEFKEFDFNPLSEKKLIDIFECVINDTDLFGDETYIYIDYNKGAAYYDIEVFDFHKRLKDELGLDLEDEQGLDTIQVWAKKRNIRFIESLHIGSDYWEGQITQAIDGNGKTIYSNPLNRAS
jgi:hypothetical protein